MRRIRSSSSSFSTSTFALTLTLVVLLTLLSPLTSSLSPFRSIVFVSGGASSTSPTKVPTTISASVNSLFVPLIQKAYTAYTLDHPEFPPLTIKTTSGSAAALAAASTGEYDFVVATNSIPYANQAAFPSMRTYPLVVNSFAPFYNLPVDVVGTSNPLVLTSLVACQIWRKEITLWNDTRIQATNPTMTLPGQQIRVIMFGYATEANLGGSRLCSKIDPVWNATYGVTNQPNIPPPVTKITSSQGGSGLGSTVVDTPYSFGWAGVPTAALIRSVRVASLVNAAGQVVAPTAPATSQTFLEMAATGFIADGTGFDLTNPASPLAWPVSQSGWIWIDRLKARSTCATKRAIIEFVLWFYESSLVATLATDQGIATLPPLFLYDYGLLQILKSDMLCDGTPLLSADTKTVRYQGSPSISSSMTLFTKLYQVRDETYTFAFEQTSEPLALQRVSASEIDFALISTAALTDAAIDAFTQPWLDTTTVAGVTTTVQQTGGLIIPAYLTGVVPTYNLPTEITTLYAQWSKSNTMGLPPLYPLVISMDLVVMVFASYVSSWTDPLMLKLNPQLGPWFNRTNASTIIRMVTCCSDTSDPAIAGTLLTKPAVRTNFARQAFGKVNTDLSTLTFFKGTLQPLSGGRMAVIENESRLSAKLLMTPGSVSYRLIDTPEPKLSSDFWLLNDRGEVIEPSPASMRQCAEYYSYNEQSFYSVIANPKLKFFDTNIPGCYPLTALISVAIASQHTNADLLASTSTVKSGSIISAVRQGGCPRARRILELLQWLQASDSMEIPTKSNGLVRLGDIERIRRYIVEDKLNSVTCDGKTILINLPVVWVVSSATSNFAIAAATIGVLACIITGIFLYYYRAHPAIRSSSPFFMIQVLLGLVLLLMALPSWAAPVEEGTCLSFAWLGNLGFTLVFAPLFAKTWRIYAIFAEKRMKVVKIPNSRLALMVLSMLAFELVILALWTGINPLRPITYEMDVGTGDDLTVHKLTHCSVDGRGMAFVAIEAVFKGCLLLFGSLMGFSTRKVVSTFNESGQIAWAIYNVVFSGIIVTAIIVFIDTLGETLILLVLLLLVWVIYTTWAFIFVPKALAVFNKDDAAKKGLLAGGGIGAGAGNAHGGNNSLNGSDHNNSGSSGYSFVNILNLNLAQLQTYGKSLEHQVERVRRRVQMLGGSGAHVGSTTSIGRINHHHSNTTNGTNLGSPPLIPTVPTTTNQTQALTLGPAHSQGQSQGQAPIQTQGQVQGQGQGQAQPPSPVPEEGAILPSRRSQSISIASRSTSHVRGASSDDMVTAFKSNVKSLTVNVNPLPPSSSKEGTPIPMIHHPHSTEMMPLTTFQNTPITTTAVVATLPAQSPTVFLQSSPSSKRSTLEIDHASATADGGTSGHDRAFIPSPSNPTSSPNPSASPSMLALPASPSPTSPISPALGAATVITSQPSNGIITITSTLSPSVQPPFSLARVTPADLSGTGGTASAASSPSNATSSISQRTHHVRKPSSRAGTGGPVMKV